MGCDNRYDDPIDYHEMERNLVTSSWRQFLAYKRLSDIKEAKERCKNVGIIDCAKNAATPSGILVEQKGYEFETKLVISDTPHLKKMLGELALDTNRYLMQRGMAWEPQKEYHFIRGDDTIVYMDRRNPVRKEKGKMKSVGRNILCRREKEKEIGDVDSTVLVLEDLAQGYAFVGMITKALANSYILDTHHGRIYVLDLSTCRAGKRTMSQLEIEYKETILGFPDQRICDEQFLDDMHELSSDIAKRNNLRYTTKTKTEFARERK